MANSNKVEENVMDFLYKSAADYGKIKQEQFTYDKFNELVEGKIKSPIEKLFYLACCVIAEREACPINPDPIDMDTQGWGIHIYPQYEIGKYRVDFMISTTFHPSVNKQSIVVELDGHEFHDKNKTQRSYEKARDRFLVSSGYRVVHFTGSDVVKDPYAVAFECLELMGLCNAFGDEPYDSNNPLGFN